MFGEQLEALVAKEDMGMDRVRGDKGGQLGRGSFLGRIKLTFYSECYMNRLEKFKENERGVIHSVFSVLGIK